jgi:hypothetical protein
LAERRPGSEAVAPPGAICVIPASCHAFGPHCHKSVNINSSFGIPDEEKPDGKGGLANHHAHASWID